MTVGFGAVTSRLRLGRWIGLGLLAVALGAAGCSTAAPKEEARGSQPPSATPTSSRPAPTPVALALVPADQAAEVAPGEPVTVHATSGKLTEVVVTGQDGKAVAGQLSPDGASWQSTEALGYAKSYTAKATGQGTDGKTATATSTFVTAKPRRQTGLSMNPLDGQTVGVGQPLAFYFDTAVDRAAAQKAIHITTTPATEGAFYWFSDREVHWRPKEYWQSGTKVAIDAAIYGKNLGNGIFGKEDRHAAITIGNSVVALADGATHQMTVTVNGTVARTIPISMGKKGHETPIGTYVVMGEYTNYVMDSSTYGVPVDSPAGYRTNIAYATRMSNSGVFYHSAPWSVRQQGHSNVSHGCLNMSTENAAWMQSIAQKGDIVVVQNSGGPQLETWDGLGDWQLTWTQWLAGGKA
ncbi:MAG: Ig-like domain-containing protein [Labedaea sp.]